MNPPPLLCIEGLRAGYGHVEVLHGISLIVPVGRMVAIVGPKGLSQDKRIVRKESGDG
jgi:branched-chain amino acid transport system ATP-binding protein